MKLSANWRPRQAEGGKETEALPDYNLYRLSQTEAKRYFGAASAALFCVGFLFYKSILLSSCLALCAVPLKKRWELCLAQRRKEMLTAQFRDLLYSLSASTAAGRQLPEAFAEAGEQLLISFGPESLLYREVNFMVKSMRESRQSLEALLQDFAVRSHVPEIRQFVRVCAVCKGTGGDMERVMGKTAAVLMEKIAVKREIQMVTAQKRLEAKILTAIPVAMVFLLNVLSPDYLAVLYEGLSGRLIMSAALGGIAASYQLSRRMTEISV